MPFTHKERRQTIPNTEQNFPYSYITTSYIHTCIHIHTRNANLILVQIKLTKTLTMSEYIVRKVDGRNVVGHDESQIGLKQSGQKQYLDNLHYPEQH